MKFTQITLQYFNFFLLILIIISIPKITNAQNTLIAPTIIEYKPSYTNVDLVWKDQNYHGIKYRVYRSNDGSANWTQVGTVDYKWTPYFSDNIGWGTKRYYRVSAFDPSTGATSDYSNVVSVTTPSAPSGPVYYVDATNGNDNNSGTSESKAWKTLSKVNSSTGSFTPGTRILFKRGEEWTGNIILNYGGGSLNNPVIFDAYGSGNLPVINCQTANPIYGIRPFYVIRNLHIKSGNGFGGIKFDTGMNTSGCEVLNCVVENINPTSKHTAGISMGDIEPNGNNRIAFNDISGYTVNLSYTRGQNTKLEFNYIHDSDGGDPNNQDALGVGGLPVSLKGTIVRYNHITGWSDDGIDTQQGGLNIVYEYNYIHHPKRDGYEGSGLKIEGTGHIVRYNVIHSLYADGSVSSTGGNGVSNAIQLKNGEQDAYGNLLWDIKGSGIIVEDGSNNNIYNNTINSDRSAVGISSSTTGIITIQNNILNAYGTGTSNIGAPSQDLFANGKTIQGGYNIFVNDSDILYSSNYSGKSNDFFKTDPKFVNTDKFDFRLYENSPCIQAGTSLVGFTSDIFGNKISSGAKPSIGALQLSSSGSINPSSGLNIDIKIFLEGTYSSNNLMEAQLNSAGLLPLIQPYNISPWNYAGTESISSFPSDIVDWVLVELRSSTSSSSKVAIKAALLKTNGHIVGLDGNSPLSFNAAEGNYYIVVKHRNHLSVMSTNSVVLSNSLTSYDFTTSKEKTYGNESLKNLGNGVYGMIAGDGKTSGTIDASDYDDVSSGMFETGYKNCDTDMNGIVNVLDYGKSNANLNKSSQIQE